MLKIKMELNTVLVLVMAYLAGRVQSQDRPRLDLTDCGTHKGCFRYPSDCTNTMNCQHILTWVSLNGKEVDFAVYSNVSNDDRWTAIGFSDDQKMGNDSVIDCIYNESDTKMMAQASWNNDIPNNEVLKNNQLGLVPGVSQGIYNNGALTCQMTRHVIVRNSSEQGRVYDLNNTYYIFLANGPASNGMKMAHTSPPAMSSIKVNVSSLKYVNVQNLDESKDTVHSHTVATIDLSGCGKSKGCYRYPTDCKSEDDCTHILTWQPDSSQVNFERFANLGTNNTWTAVGFSYDKKMGNDSVVDCIYNDSSKDPEVIVQSSWNTESPNIGIDVLKNNKLGLLTKNQATSYKDGKLYCKFSRSIVVRSDAESSMVFDLNATYYLFLPRGPGKAGVKSPHTESPAISPVQVNVTSMNYADIGHTVIPTIDLSKCGKSMGCYRDPTNCMTMEKCNHILTWEATPKEVNFNLYSALDKGETWTAVGFSYDQKMGNDSVTDCIFNDSSSDVIIQSSWNNMTPNNEVLENKKLGLTASPTGTYTDGKILCQFSRSIVPAKDVAESTKVFALNDTYYLFLPKGPGKGGIKAVHTEHPISPLKVNVSSTKYVDLGHDVQELIDISKCGKELGCYKDPSTCTTMKDCVHFLTWKLNRNNSEVEFIISSQLTSSNKWTAIGFSYDQQMGNDSVVDCIYNDTAGSVLIQSSWNPGHSNEPLKDNKLGLVPGKTIGTYTTERIECHFTREITVRNNKEANEVFDLNQTFYLFLARGDAMNGVKQKHSETPAISPVKVNVTSKSYVFVGGTSKSALVITHGSFMIIAWMLLTSIGVLLPKYFKDGSLKEFCLEKAAWFQAHRLIMVTVMVLTCSAFIIIFIEIKGYAKDLTGLDAAHPVLGILATSLVILNPLLGMLRPSQDSPHRPIFKAVHMTVGYLVHIVAAVALFVGTRLAKADMSNWAPWLVLAYFVWHAVMEAIYKNHNKEVQNRQVKYGPIWKKMKADSPSSGDSETEVLTNQGEDTYAYSNNCDMSERQSSSRNFKRLLFGTHFCVMLGCTIALIADLIK